MLSSWVFWTWMVLGYFVVALTAYWVPAFFLDFYDRMDRSSDIPPLAIMAVLWPIILVILIALLPIKGIIKLQNHIYNWSYHRIEQRKEAARAEQRKQEEALFAEQRARAQHADRYT